MALTDFLLSPTGLLMVAAVLAAMGYLGYATYIDSSKTIMMFRRKDRRILTIPVAKETDIAVIGRTKEGVVRRFFRTSPAWTTSNRKTVFLGVEGIAYTGQIADGGVKHQVTLAAALESMWGEAYKKLPANLRKPIEDDKVGLTVEILPIQPDGLPSISSDQINDQDDSLILTKLAKSSGMGKTKWESLTLIGLGAGLTGTIFLVYLMQAGVIKFAQ